MYSFKIKESSKKNEISATEANDGIRMLWTACGETRWSVVGQHKTWAGGGRRQARARRLAKHARVPGTARRAGWPNVATSTQNKQLLGECPQLIRDHR
ncbi:unnamed protein product [Danaus chrysippus]|uniref:(African queen) hypothetical protein n=1 Tax=Danaus chrysippus TaxID=151541 RepID=A0A8J2R4X4_9NEOP|nr:unnamed protein product [Danaus chrysippus]